MEFAELKKMDIASLNNEVNSLRKELFNLRLSFMAGQVKDVSQFKKLRVKIAQCLTLIQQGGVSTPATTGAKKEKKR